DQYSYSKLDIDEKVDAIKILNTEQKEQLRALLYAYLHVFSKRPGRFKGFRMAIETVDEIPVSDKPYRISRMKQLQVDEHIRQMEELGIIKKGYSAFAAPTFICPKKNCPQGRFVI